MVKLENVQDGDVFELLKAQAETDIQKGDYVEAIKHLQWVIFGLEPNRHLQLYDEKVAPYQAKIRSLLVRIFNEGKEQQLKALAMNKVRYPKVIGLFKTVTRHAISNEGLCALIDKVSLLSKSSDDQLKKDFFNQVVTEYQRKKSIFSSESSELLLDYLRAQMVLIDNKFERFLEYVFDIQRHAFNNNGKCLFAVIAKVLDQMNLTPVSGLKVG